MKRYITNVHLWTILVASVTMFIPVALWAPRQFAFEVCDALCVALAIGGASSYSREAWNAIKLPIHRMVSAHYIVTGVFFAALAMGILFGGLWYWRVMDKPPLLIDSTAILFSRFLSVIALGLFMVTSYSRGGVVSLTAYRWPTIVTVLTLVLIACVWVLLVG